MSPGPLRSRSGRSRTTLLEKLNGRPRIELKVIAAVLKRSVTEKWTKTGRETGTARVGPGQRADRAAGNGLDGAFSACNLLTAALASVSPVASNTEATAQSADRLEVVAVVTQNAVDEMGLTPGAQVTALVKASVVMLVKVV